MILCCKLHRLLIDCASVLPAALRHERAKDFTRLLSQQRSCNVLMGKVLALSNTCTQIIFVSKLLDICGFPLPETVLGGPNWGTTVNCLTAKMVPDQ